MICHIHSSILLTVSEKSTSCCTLLMKAVIWYQEFQIVREQELPQVIYNHIGIACMRFMRSYCLINSRSCKGKLYVSCRGRSGNNISMLLIRLFLQKENCAGTILIVIQKKYEENSHTVHGRLIIDSIRIQIILKRHGKKIRLLCQPCFFNFFTQYACALSGMAIDHLWQILSSSCS